MSTFLTLSVLAGIPMYFLIWHALRPFRVDSHDLSRFAGVGHQWTIYSFTGRASNVSKGSSTTAGLSYTDGSVATYSTTTITDQIFLTDAQGNERSFQVTDFNAAIANDHLVSVAWAQHGSKFVWLVVYNHTTDTYYLGRTDKAQPLLQISTPHAGAKGCLNMFLFFFPTVFVSILLWAWLIRVQTKSFRRSGVMPLLSGLKRAASQFPQRSAIHADELDKLSALAKEGLLTGEEWTRAKNLFLGQPPDGRALALQHLGQVYSLYKEGALSE